MSAQQTTKKCRTKKATNALRTQAPDEPTYFDVETGRQIGIEFITFDPVERALSALGSNAADSNVTLANVTCVTRGHGTWKPVYLAAIALTGSSVAAAEAAGIAPTTYRRARKSDAEFAQAEREARRAAADRLELEARRRAVEGVLEPVYHQGQICGVLRRYSDKLLMKLLDGNKPKKFRQRVENVHKPSTTKPMPSRDGMYASIAARLLRDS